ncbi:MAG: YigZ family protein [Ruminococcaceae bacterium]|nr:YigZ family protein [Oscillospiraceae bacterium]
MTTYLVPADAGAGEYIEKRSRFIGQIRPVETEAEAQAMIAAVKKEHYDARHNCFAYIIREGGVMRYGDDGEPQGTAGQPILAVLSGAGVQNVCCTVTRYFGGVLLGTGGLVRAYTAAAKAALDDAGISQMALWQSISLRCAYNMFERVRRLLDEHEAVLENTDYGADIVISALVREDKTAAFSDALREMSAGSIGFEVEGSRFCGVRIV